jgi:methionyl-tRNA formyltransferase
MGTPALAAHILERLADAPRGLMHVVGVVTRPDEPRGRGLAVEQSEVASVAARHGIPTLKPAKIRTAEFLKALESFAPDLLIVAAYGRILPKAVLDAARVMPINVHASLLPRHRGASPVEAAILAGDPETGVTIMRMTERMDAGPMLLKRAVPIAPDDTQATLKEKLARVGADALIDALKLLARGELREEAQDERLATYCAPVKKTDAVIDWRAEAARIARMTRAYDPWPVARTTLGGADLLVWRAAVEDESATDDAAPGTFVRLKPAPIIQCGLGRLRLVEVQAAGRRRMAADEFFRGRRIAEGARLGT